MQRIPILLALLGLVYAGARPAGAQQTEATLFGRKYTVLCESRAQTYKNGKTVVIPDFGASNRKANLWFTQGADRAQDRLFVVCPINETDNSITGHQFYLLTGTDANGLFSPSAAALTEYFGGNLPGSQGGRPIAVIHLHDEQTGTKVDRNLLLITFAGDDREGYYDLDSLSTDFRSAAVASRSFFGFAAYARGPSGTIVRFANTPPEPASPPAVGVTEPKQGRPFSAVTDLAAVTKTATIPFTPELWVTGAGLYGGEPAQGTGEYWLLTSTAVPEGDSDSTEKNQLWRLRLRFPADLATAARGSIQVEVLGPPQELKGTPLHSSDGGVFGMAVGREVAPGLRRLYFADWQGNLCTATPLP